MSGIKTELTFHRWALLLLVIISSVLFYKIETLNSRISGNLADVRAEISLTSEALITAVSKVVSRYEDKNRRHKHIYSTGEPGRGD